MIISHKHRFIFIKTRKTAGTSIETALSSICGPDDVITPFNPEDERFRLKHNGKTPQNLLIPLAKYRFKDWIKYFFKFEKTRFYNHMPARQLKLYVGKGIWQDYFIFCFERHPVTKSLSHFNWMRIHKSGHKNYEDYLKSNKVELIKGRNFYKNKQGDYLVNKVYKMEDLKQALLNISEGLKIEPNLLSLPTEKLKEFSDESPISEEEVRVKYDVELRRLFRDEYEDIYNAEETK